MDGEGQRNPSEAALDRVSTQLPDSSIFQTHFHLYGLFDSLISQLASYEVFMCVFVGCVLGGRSSVSRRRKREARLA